MSKIALEPNASGTGVFSIASPNSNNNRTLTLPDATGTLATTADIPAAGGMTLLGTLATTSGSSVTLSGLDLTGYKFLQLSISAISSTSATDSMNFNGYSAAQVTSGGEDRVTYGGGFIDLSTGAFYVSSVILNGTAIAGQSTRGGPSGLTTASTSITFTLSSGTFDAGSIKVYGVA